MDAIEETIKEEESDDETLTKEILENSKKQWNISKQISLPEGDEKVEYANSMNQVKLTNHISPFLSPQGSCNTLSGSMYTASDGMRTSVSGNTGEGLDEFGTPIGGSLVSFRRSISDGLDYRVFSSCHSRLGYMYEREEIEPRIEDDENHDIENALNEEILKDMQKIKRVKSKDNIKEKVFKGLKSHSGSGRSDKRKDSGGVQIIVNAEGKSSAVSSGAKVVHGILKSSVSSDSGSIKSKTVKTQSQSTSWGGTKALLIEKTDWEKCCLCQERRDEELRSHREHISKFCVGYSMIANNVPEFHAMHELPIVLDPARLDDGCDIEGTLRKKQAKYHESCRIKFNNTKLERVRESKRKTEKAKPEECQTKLRRISIEGFACFLCGKESPSSELTKVMTMNLNNRLNECAKTLNDLKLISRLSGGDAIAQEFKYQLACLNDLYNRERKYLGAIKKLEKVHEPQNEAYPQAFSELVTYLVETKRCEENPVSFRLTDLVHTYTERLEQLGVYKPVVNPTRLKEKLLSEIPDLEDHKKGKHVFLAFKEDVGLVLSKATDYYNDNDAIILSKAASILRRHMLNHKSAFDGTFHEGCIEESIPPTLFQFLAMLEHGADIKSQIRFGTSKTDLAIAQLLRYNCYERYKEGASTHRHSKNRETPFPVYMGMSIYAKTRKRTLVDMYHEHEISISYDRVLEISAQLGDATISKYVEDGIVCPPALRKGLFTTSAMDNIDHNPTATTATTSFHGTSISVFQHPTHDNEGEDRGQLNFGQDKVKKVPELPDTFINVKPAFFTKTKPSPPQSKMPHPDPSLIISSLAMEYEWLEKVILTEGSAEVTWSAHHASQKRGKSFDISITSLLPLLREQAHSVATVKHVLERVGEIVEFLNPGQVPVVAADQPIYAVAKQVQWHWPETYGEDKFVMMFGGLHIEMAPMKSIGTLLIDSGWTGALVESGVASPETADSFLSASSVTRTRLMHQVTAYSLYQLMKEAYTNYLKDSESLNEAFSFETWCEHRKHQSLQFHFWYMIFSMELVILLLIRSFREANFQLYCESLAGLIPYFFANNNVNYARWLQIHYRDMMNLEQKHPQVAQEFHSGKFIVHKSSRQFSAIAIDQAHEQANALIKADWGAIGLTEEPSALRRWMIAGPEVCHLISQYETECGAKVGIVKSSHHEQTERAQKGFLEKVEKLSKTMKEIGNPFMEDSCDLITSDTKDIAHHTAEEQVNTHFEKGKAQFEEFMKRIEVGESSSFYKPIKKNKVDFFRQLSTSTYSLKQKGWKEDCQLFSKLFISCQSRECDLKEFFRHENQSYPAALSDGGKLHACQKSHLTTILENRVTLPESEPDADTFIVDGSAMVNCIPPRNRKTFEEYAVLDVLPTIQISYRRIDIVFDVFRPSSLKAETRSKRGHGARRRVTRDGKIPQNWRNFLRENDNKAQIFSFLADIIASYATPNVVIVTKEEDVVSKDTINKAGLAPCSHEEADTRIFVHARHATEAGSKSIIVKASDTDVVVIAIGILDSLQDLGLQELWIAFGQGQNFRWIPVHDLYYNLAEKSAGIMFFHAFTGCDVVSAFRGKGKMSAWKAWDVFGEVLDVFRKLSKYPLTISEEDFQTLEKFVVMMYDRSSTVETVNEARLDMFARKQRPYEAIPPTKAALEQHVKRAAYQAGCVWSQSTHCQPETKTPSGWRWIER